MRYLFTSILVNFLAVSTAAMAAELEKCASVEFIRITKQASGDEAIVMSRKGVSAKTTECFVLDDDWAATLIGLNSLLFKKYLLLDPSNELTSTEKEALLQKSLSSEYSVIKEALIRNLGRLKKYEEEKFQELSKLSPMCSNVKRMHFWKS